jgi:hypothetical protein
MARAGEPVVHLVRLRSNRGIGLGGLKGQIPENRIADIAERLSRKELETLFGRGLVP